MQPRSARGSKAFPLRRLHALSSATVCTVHVNDWRKFMEFLSAEWLSALMAIILANILLSGDNAVVIALAARSLPPHQQKQAIIGGSAAAIVMRIVLTVLAVEMLKWPYLKLVGGLALLYIGVTLMLEDGGEEEGHNVGSGMMAAIRTILIADLGRSLDNVLAVAAAAKGEMSLLIIGLGISIPLIIFGSTMLLKVMERFPIIITIGAALLGFLAGEMLVTDPAVIGWVGEMPHSTEKIIGAIGATGVVLVGLALQRRAKARAATATAVTARTVSEG
jgi:YjbE family integral membrane protein